MTKPKLKLYLTFTPNNIHLNLSSLKGHTLFKSSGGCIDQRGKTRPKTAQILVQELLTFITNQELAKEEILFFFKGFNKARFNMLKILLQSSLKIFKIYYICAKPFNGCRKKKQRRLLYFF